ncbi:MAG: ferritin-like domain-containing protein [Polyangiaceae bacterium]|nr:ferritin-like domain-containing protein [Polyangiaceae bacterium]
MRPHVAAFVRALLGASLVPAAACGCPSGPDDIESSDYVVSGKPAGEGGGAGTTPADQTAACDGLCRGSKAYAKYLDAGFFESEISVTGCTKLDDDTVECTLSVECTAGRRPAQLASSPVECSSARDYWRATAALERAAVIAFEELAAMLRHHGAPSDLVRRALAAAEDERRHTRVALGLADEAGEPAAPAIAPPASLSLCELALLNAREGCVLEAFAALQLAWQARTVPDPEVRYALAQIAVDEAEHAELAWDIDEWLAGRLSAAESEEVARERRRTAAALPRSMEAAPWLNHIGLAQARGLRALRDNFVSMVVA